MFLNTWPIFTVCGVLCGSGDLPLVSQPDPGLFLLVSGVFQVIKLWRTTGRQLVSFPVTTEPVHFKKKPNQSEISDQPSLDPFLYFVSWHWLWIRCWRFFLSLLLVLLVPCRSSHWPVQPIWSGSWRFVPPQTSQTSLNAEGPSLFAASCLPVNLILSNAWKNINVECFFPPFPWKRSSSLSVMRSNVSFFCSRCRKCGTGGYLLTSTSSRKFDSCATDSSAPTNQHGLAAQAPPIRGGPQLPCCYLRVLFFSSAEVRSKVRWQF